jgi:hypothetical protein
MFITVELKKNNRAIYWQEKVSGWISGRKDLHVSGICCIPNVDRVYKDTGGHIHARHFLPDSIQSVVAHAFQVNVGWRCIFEPDLI